MEIAIAIGLFVGGIILILSVIKRSEEEYRRKREEEERKAREDRRKADEDRRKAREDFKVRLNALRNAYDNLKLEHGIEKADDLQLMNIAALVGMFLKTRKSLKLNGEYVGIVASANNYNECACSWCNKTVIENKDCFRVFYNGDFVSVPDGPSCTWCSLACAKSEMESR